MKTVWTILLLLCLPAFLEAQSKPPTVGETKAWLAEKLDVGEDAAHLYSMGDCQGHPMSMSTNVTKWGDVCTLEFEQDTDRGCSSAGIVYEEDRRIILDLSVIDPEKIQVGCEGEGCALRFETTDGKEAIAAYYLEDIFWKKFEILKRLKRDDSKPHFISHVWLVRGDRGVAERMKKAFVGLIRFCGGKPSKREPF